MSSIYRPPCNQQHQLKIESVNFLIPHSASASPSSSTSSFSHELSRHHYDIIDQKHSPKILVNNKTNGWRSRIQSKLDDNALVDPSTVVGDSDDVIALIDAPIQRLSNPIHLPYAPCSSCGNAPAATDATGHDQNEQEFIQLLSCHHILCPTCLSSLVNAISNDPPRPGACFACNTLVEVAGFRGIHFTPLPSVAAGNDPLKTPEKMEKRFEMELSPFRKLDWSENASTPGTTPGSTRKKLIASDLLFSIMSEVDGTAAPIYKSVVRVDNIPWNITVQDVIDWMPQSIASGGFETDDELFVHILCNRADAKTLNQLYIEMQNVELAFSLIRSKNGKKLMGRYVSVSLSNQSELLEQIFPNYDRGFCAHSTDANVDPFSEGGGDDSIIGNDDLLGLMELCQLDEFDTSRTPERAYLNIVTILKKFPWHQPEIYSQKLVAKFHFLVECALQSLMTPGDKFPTQESFSYVIKTLIKAALTYPPFRSGQKNRLINIVTRAAGAQSPVAHCQENSNSTSPPSSSPSSSSTSSSRYVSALTPTRLPAVHESPFELPQFIPQISPSPALFINSHSVKSTFIPSSAFNHATSSPTRISWRQSGVEIARMDAAWDDEKKKEILTQE